MSLPNFTVGLCSLCLDWAVLTVYNYSAKIESLTLGNEQILSHPNFSKCIPFLFCQTNVKFSFLFLKSSECKIYELPKLNSLFFYIYELVA